MLALLQAIGVEIGVPIASKWASNGGATHNPICIVMQLIWIRRG